MEMFPSADALNAAATAKLAQLKVTICMTQGPTELNARSHVAPRRRHDLASRKIAVRHGDDS